MPEYREVVETVTRRVLVCAADDCDKPIQGRADKRYCSGACRLHAFRQRRKAERAAREAAAFHEERNGLIG